MRINSSYVLSSNNQQKTKQKFLNFKSFDMTAARKIEAELAKKGIRAEFRGNDFVGDCLKKVVNLYEKLFNKNSLPKELNYKPTHSSIYGCYFHISNEVVINKAHDKDCFEDLKTLKAQASKNYNPIFPSWSSSGHPAHVFVHEFAHAAHWHHMKNRNGESDATKVWRGLEGTTVPTSIGRLITRFKLSNYAVDANDMCEFIAERVAKDICKNITDDSWILCNNVDVKYSDIFNRNWSYRYSSPQSYIDYFTQQVWNGDIDGAKKVANDAEEYLARLDTSPVPRIITEIEQKVEPDTITANLVRGTRRIFTNITNFFDNLNDIRINNNDKLLMH